jgi:hypothetical protein
MNAHSAESFQQSNIRRHLKMLNRWQGANARLRELTSGHQSLRVELTQLERSGNLLISCISPIYIEGPTYWSNSMIEISPAILEDGTEGIMLRDLSANVKILAETFEVAENVRL